MTAAPIVTWWLVGDQTSRGFNEDQLDYFVRAPDWATAHARVAGVVALIALIVPVTVLAWAAMTRRMNPDWTIVVVLLMAVGVIAAVVYRFMTAGGIGANIGGGVSFILGAPVVVGLLLWSLASALTTISEDRETRRQTPNGTAPRR